jgi:hypothetical protein
MKGKIKNIFYILIFLLSFVTVLANTTTSVEPVWFATPSEYNGTEGGIKNGALYNDSWCGINFTKENKAVKIIESLNNMKGMNGSKFGDNFFAIPVTSNNKLENGWLGVKLNRTLQVSQEYNIRFWYQNGWEESDITTGLSGSVTTEVYLVQELPVLESAAGQPTNPSDYLQDKKHILTLDDTGDSTNWEKICSLKFTVEEEGEYYLLFVPKLDISQNPSGGISVKNTAVRYFAIEQANSNVISMSAEASDEGVKFVEGIYKNTYGQGDKYIGKNEKVKVILKLSNSSLYDWNHENHIAIDVSNIGIVETGTDSFSRVKGGTKEILTVGEKYEVETINGGTTLIFRGKELLNEDKADYYEYVFFIEYDYTKEDNLTINYKIYDFLESDNINSGKNIKEEIKTGNMEFLTLRDVSRESSTIVKNHSILRVKKDNVNTTSGLKGYLKSLDNSYINKLLNTLSNDEEDIVKLGNSIGGNDSSADDGWIETLRSTERTLYYGNNTLKIQVSHSGYVAGYLYKGTLTATGMNWSWEKVFEVPVTGVGETGKSNGNEVEKELYQGINRITFTTPSDTDDMSKFILKYSINREDVKSLTEYGMSGEIEDYDIKPGISFGANIIERKDLGIPQDITDAEYEGIIGKEDNKYSYRERVEYTVAIKNSQAVSIRNKRLTFKSNMAVVDVSSLTVNENPQNGGGYSYSAKIPRIEKKPNQEGMYEILINEIPANTTYNVRFEAELLREDFEEEDEEWILKDELLDGVLDVTDKDNNTLPKIVIENREYGNNYEGYLNKITEVRHYNPFIGEESKFLLKLGKNVTYDNEIHAINQDSTNDGVYLQKYTGEKSLYKDKYALFTGIKSPVYVGIDKLNSWVSVWINNEERWQEGTADRYFVFRNYDTSGYKYEGNPDGIENIENLGERIYKLEIQPPDQPGIFKTLRVRTAYNQIEIDDPLETASSGEVEDYEVVILPPLEPIIKFTNLGVPINGENHWADNGEDKKLPVRFGSKVRYEIEIKNLVNMTLEGKSIVFRTNMVTLDLKSFTKEELEGEDVDNSVNITVKERERSLPGYKEYEFILDEIDPLKKTKIVVEGTVDREDTTEWELIDSFWADGALWEESRRGYLDRNYGSFSGDLINHREARHYKLLLNDGSIAKLGVNLPEFNNDASKINNDNIVFPLINGERVIYENGNTPLTLNVSHNGFVSAWIRKVNSTEWEPILVLNNQVGISKSVPVIEGENTIIVRTKEVLDKNHIVRIRYSLLERDVLEATGPAITGEVEDYSVLGKEILKVRFTNDSHTDEGIVTDEGLVGADDGQVSYKENVRYKFTVENLSDSDITDQEIVLRTNLGKILDLRDFEIVSSVNNIDNDTLKDNIKIEDISKVGNNYSEYLIKIKNMLAREILTIKPVVNMDKEYIEIKSDEEYDFMLRDSIFVANVERATHKLLIEDMDYERSIIGYYVENENEENKYDMYDRFYKRARHNVVKLSKDSTEKIQLGKTNTGDRNQDLTDGILKGLKNIRILQEKDKALYDSYSYGDGVALRIKAENGSGDIEGSGIPANDLLLGPWNNNGPEDEGYILYNKAKNILPITVNHDGYVGIWIRYNDYTYGNGKGYDYNKHTYKWNDDSSVFYGPFKVEASKVNNIEIDLSNREGWQYDHYPASSSYHSTDQDFRITKTANIRVRYGLTEEEVKTPTGIATAGEVEDYKINSFISPFKVEFGAIDDLGIIKDDSAEKKERIGANDGLLTYEEDFTRSIYVTNVTRATQTNKKIILRTSMSSITNLDDFESGNIIIKKIGNDQYIDRHYPGVYFTEYEITIASIQANEEIEIPLEMKIDKTGDSYRYNYTGETYSWHFLQYVQYEKRTIQESDYGRLFHDRGYQGYYNDTLKHFQFQLEGNNVSLGSGITYEPSEKDSGGKDETETGDALVEEGVKNFPKYQTRWETAAENTLFSSADHIFNIEVTHDGYVGIYTNIGTSSAENWVTLLEPQEVKANQINNLKFKFLPDLEGEENKILRVRYGIRKKDALGNGDNPLLIASTGEVEDYKYRVMPPITAKFLKWDDLGVETDIKNTDGSNFWGKNDGNWGLKSIIKQHIQIENLTDSDFLVQDLATKLIKFQTNLGTITDGKEDFALEIEKNVDGQIVTEKITENISDYFEIVSQKDVGTEKVYYFQLKKLEPKTKYNISFNFKIERENYYLNLENELWIVRDDEEEGILQEKTSDPEIIDAKFPNAKIDGGFGGWHYFTLERPHLSKNKNGITYEDDFFYGSHYARTNEHTSADDDGVDVYTYSDYVGATPIYTLISNVENEITIYPTHKGFVRVWLGDSWVSDPGNEIPLTNIIEITDEDLTNQGKKIIFYVPDKHPKTSVSLHSNEANRYLKVKYTLIKEELEGEKSSNYIEHRTGAATGESEDYHVRVLPPLDLRFIDYTELGVNGSELPNERDRYTYGLGINKEGDGNVGFGERVRETFRVTNISEVTFKNDNPTPTNFDNKLIELNMKNAILELASDGTVDLNKLNLEVIMLDTKTRAVRNITSEATVEYVEHGKYRFKLKEIYPHSEISITYNYLVDSDTDASNVVNSIGIYNNSNIERDNTNSAKINKIQVTNPKYPYPYMKRDYNAEGSSSYGLGRHHYVNEMPHLGNLVGYETTGNSLENDGLIIKNIQRFGEATATPTLFSEEWNELELPKISHNGYIRIWINDELIPIQQNENDTAGTTEPFSVNASDETTKIKIKPPIKFESKWGQTFHELTIRYSVYAGDLTDDVNGASRIGEAEQYLVRVIPPLDGRFVHVAESSNGEKNLRRDLGVKLNSTRAPGVEEILGKLDGNYTLRELYKEQIFIKNLNSEDTQTKTLTFESNISVPYKDYDKEGIEVKLYAKDIVPGETAYDIVKDLYEITGTDAPTATYSGSNVTISNLKLKANQQGVLVFKLKVTAEDTNLWKIKNNFTISNTFQDTTYEGETVYDDREHPLILEKNHSLNKEGYYPQFKRDYENDSAPYDLSYGYYYANGGVRSYLINRESTIPENVDLILNNTEGKSLNQNYASLGEKIYPENVYTSYGHEIPWASGSITAIADDDDSLTGPGAKDDGRNLGDIHQKNGRFILYNNANNLFPIEVTKDGYVTISLWTRAGHNSDGDSWADKDNAEFLTTEPIFVEAGEKGNNIVVPIDNKWFADYWPYYDENLQNDKSRYGVLRVKYALEKDDPGLNNIDGRVLYTGEVEDYQIASFEPALAIDNVEITDMGLNDPRENSTTIEDYNKGDGYLSYGEYYYYTLTIHNPSTAIQTKSFIHVNGRGDLGNNKDLKEEELNNIQKYREIYPEKIEIIDQQECPNTTVKIGSYKEPEFSGDDGKDAKITVENLPPGKSIKVRYLARIIAEHEIGYNEDLESGWNHMYKNTEVYKWYGKDEFWLDRRKLILNPRNISDYTSNLQKLLENGSNTNILLKGQGSEGNGNDILTARDYGNGYIGYKATDGTVIGQTPLTETRHHKAVSSNGSVMQIGNGITFENSIKDISDTDGVEFLHKIENEKDIVIYGGIQNGLIIDVTHDGYLSFFLNNGEDYIHGISNTDYWKNDDILLAAIDTRTETTQIPLPDEAFSSNPIKVEGNKEGGNKIAIKVPDYPESTRILRIRYAAHAEDIVTPTGTARTGEVQDIIVRVVPLGTGFIDNIDKGVETEGNNPSERRLGYNDKKYHYKEIYENHFRVHNDSPYIKIPAKVLLFSPTSRIADEAQLLEEEELHRIESRNSGEASDVEPLKIQKIESSWNPIKKGYDNIITINRLLAGEQADIWIHLFKEKEDIETWRATHQLWVGYLEEDGTENIILEDEESLPITERDYGSGYLNSDMIANNTIEAAKTEVRHYSLVEENGSSENIRLGINYNIEDYPRDQKEDGVSLPSNLMGELVLYNNLVNEIQIFPTKDGYITSWINQENTWDEKSEKDKILIDSVIKKIQEDGVEKEEEKENSIDTNYKNVAAIDEEYNIVRIMVPDYLEKINSSNTSGNGNYIQEIEKIFRVRYALDKDDIKDNVSPARSGEVEDYQIKIVSGLKATFEVITDLGVTIDNDVNLDGTSGVNKELHIGKQDGNLIPGEVYLHKIKVENITGVDQENINLVYKTVVGNIVNYENYDELLSTDKIEDNVKVKILNQDGEYIDSNEYYVTSVSKNSNNEIEYKITVNKIKKDEDIYIFFHSKVMKEDEVQWKLVDKVFIDGILNDLEEYLMVRDYGSGWVEGNNTLEEEARHYMIKLKLSDTQDLTPIALGLKVTQDEEIVVDIEDGVKFKKDPDYGDAIIYDNLRNKLEVTAAFPGYISFWLNSAPLNNNTSEWDVTNVVPSRREEQNMLDPYRDINTIKGRNNYPSEILVGSSQISQMSSSLTPNDYDTFYIKVPSYIQKNTTGGYEDHSQKILRFRYSIAKSDTETLNKGLANPIGTALTGEVEDYRVRLVNGFKAKLLGLIDRGIMPDKDSDSSISNNVSDEFSRIKSIKEENASRLERVGARDGNVSPRELVDTVLEVKNVTGIYQTGFIEEDKNRMLIKINNGELDTNNNFIWIRSIIEEENQPSIITEFQNVDDDEWVDNINKGDSIPKENHRVRVIERSDLSSAYNLKGNEKLYEIKIDYIKADETLQIYLRQFVTEEFTLSDENTGSKYAIRNELIFEQVDNEGNSTVKKEDSIKSLPMKRDYGTLLEGTSEDTRTRHYSTNINKEPSLEENKENPNESIGNGIQIQEMKLGDEYSTEEDPKVNPKDNDNGIEFITKSDGNNNKENILYYGFWNEVEVTLNHKGYFSVWLSGDGNNWNESLSLAVSKNDLYDDNGKIKADTNVKQVELTPDEKRNYILIFQKIYI